MGNSSKQKKEPVAEFLVGRQQKWEFPTLAADTFISKSDKHAFGQ